MVMCGSWKDREPRMTEVQPREPLGASSMKPRGSRELMNKGMLLRGLPGDSYVVPFLL